MSTGKGPTGPRDGPGQRKVGGHPPAARRPGPILAQHQKYLWGPLVDEAAYTPQYRKASALRKINNNWP